ncbi:hypothetical protein [Endozoicomonas sp. SESOKO1]|uniref:hypothetical protein n=1 Tax=Endozoicomonas sp. SESOKO1 TaxID=2828742 RepID=UPI0021475112|nr:hypothetical protein [Endozoicomonas sp. SESOKO1]
MPITCGEIAGVDGVLSALVNPLDDHRGSWLSGRSPATWGDGEKAPWFRHTNWPIVGNSDFWLNGSRAAVNIGDVSSLGCG